MNKQEAIKRLRNEKFEIIPGERFAVHAFHPDHAWGIVRLMYAVYKESYPVEAYYLPQEIIRKNREKDVFSVVTCNTSGQVVGYAALYHSSSPYRGMYEGGMYTVHPRYRNTTVAFKMNRAVLDLAHRLSEVKSIYSESVCNHLVTQKMSDRAGVHMTAFELGLMPKEAYDADETVDGRVSSVIGVLEFEAISHPVYKPDCYAEELDFIFGYLKPERNIQPAPMIRLPGKQTEMESESFDFAGVDRICIQRLGADLRERISRAISNARQRNAVLVEVFLNAADEAVASGIEELRQSGFFFCGFVPRWIDTDCYLFQKNLAEPPLSEIHLYSENAKRLLAYVQADCERARQV